MLNDKFKPIKNGSITSPRGFLAGCVYAGIKKEKKLDLGILFSEKICTACGCFTTNKIKSNPVYFSQHNLKNHKAQAIVANSGCANACTGEQGLINTQRTAARVARKLRIKTTDILVGSTGVIGINLPIDRVIAGIDGIRLTKSGGIDFAESIMTTDTLPKQIALSISDDNGAAYTIAGVAKGSGMIHPNMATMFCFITTDANVDRQFLNTALKKAVDLSFNMISVDGDTSPSDMVAILANGLADNRLISKNNGSIFQEGLNYICKYLAQCIARDGEGATKLIEVVVEHAKTINQAKTIARTIACSSLVKAAVHGNDPNWGRIVVAAGRCGANVELDKLNLYLNHTCIMSRGMPKAFNKSRLSKSMSESKEIYIQIDIGLRKANATAWGCDLSEEYVTINSAYTT